MRQGSVAIRFVAIAVQSVSVLLIALSACSRADVDQPRVVFGPWAGQLSVGPGMDATGRHLRGSEFVGQNLAGAVFDRCDLDGVRFYQCDLSGASFKGIV